MNKTLTLYKELGQTPLELLNDFRLENKEYAQVKMAYAGRLDPMAQGKLLVTVGEECKQRQKYLSLDKEYQFEVLLGVSSDTHDVLGVTSLDKKPDFARDFEKRVRVIVSSLKGKQSLPYPVFSSKTVEGNPLFLWALENRLSEIVIPTKDVEIYNLRHTKTVRINKQDLHAKIKERIGKVTQVTDESKSLGRDFRRTEVLDKWNTNLNGVQDEREFIVCTFVCICSSGTYMRTLASIIGQQLGTVGLAWSIKRTIIGRYKKLFGTFGFWIEKY